MLFCSNYAKNYASTIRQGLSPVARLLQLRKILKKIKTSGAQGKMGRAEKARSKASPLEFRARFQSSHEFSLLSNSKESLWRRHKQENAHENRPSRGNFTNLSRRSTRSVSMRVAIFNIAQCNFANTEKRRETFHNMPRIVTQIIQCNHTGKLWQTITFIYTMKPKYSSAKKFVKYT